MNPLSAIPSRQSPVGNPQPAIGRCKVLIFCRLATGNCRLFKTVLSIIGIISICEMTSAQIVPVRKEEMLDHIVAIVGNEIIMESELEIQYLSQMAMASESMSPGTKSGAKCVVLEEQLYQKLLLTQAIFDSIEISDDQVESELDRRMRFFENQIGSEQKLEEYYGKSILEIKSDFRDLVKSQMLVQKMQGNLTENIKATPSEVRAYFEKIPEDSLPFINSELEIAQIVRNPPINEEEKNRIKEKLNGIRKRIINGEDFGTLAYLYSEDPLSAKKNGELGFVQRGALVPEFEAVAFNLLEKEVSEVLETQFGFHILQLIERMGQKVNVRHILLIPKVATEDLQNAKLFLDSIYQQILIDSISFDEAAEKYSDDQQTKRNGGKMINPQTGSAVFEPAQLDPMLLFAVDKMVVGQVSGPAIMNTDDGKQAYRLLYLISRSKPHRASLETDYQRIQNASLSEKQDQAINQWIDKKRKSTFIKIEDNYKTCDFTNNWSGL